MNVEQRQKSSEDTPDEFAPDERLFDDGRDPALSDDHEDDVGARLDEGIDEDIPDAGASSEESEAREAGWVPKDEWTGPPGKWKPAKEFLDFRDHVLPLVQRENRTLRAEVEALKREREAEKIERAQSAQRIERETLRMEMKQAREDGDWDKVDQITEKMFDLRAKAVAAPAPAVPAVDPQLKRVHDEFVSANSWLKDRELQKVFYRQLKLIADTNTADSPEEAMRDAKDTVRRMYPERFRSAPRTGMAESGASHDSPSRGNGRSWNDLKPNFRRDFEETQNNLGLTGKAREESRQRILKTCDAEHFRR